MDIQIIDKIVNHTKRSKRTHIAIKEGRRIWQAHSRTVGENGLNSVNEVLRNLFHKKDKQFRKVFNIP